VRDVAVKKFVKHVVCIFLKHTRCWQITDVGHWMAPLHAARTGHCRHLLRARAQGRRRPVRISSRFQRRPVESAFIPFVSFGDLDNNTFKGLTSLLSVEQEIQYDEHT
jgi:hypothetical protein